jgi:hypothetical protein
VAHAHAAKAKAGYGEVGAEFAGFHGNCLSLF